MTKANSTSVPMNKTGEGEDPPAVLYAVTVLVLTIAALWAVVLKSKGNDPDLFFGVALILGGALLGISTLVWAVTNHQFLKGIKGKWWFGDVALPVILTAAATWVVTLGVTLVAGKTFPAEVTLIPICALPILGLAAFLMWGFRQEKFR